MSDWYVEEVRQEGKPVYWTVSKDYSFPLTPVRRHKFASFELAKRVCDSWNKPKPVITYHKVYP